MRTRTGSIASFIVELRRRTIEPIYQDEKSYPHTTTMNRYWLSVEAFEALWWLLPSSNGVIISPDLPQCKPTRRLGHCNCEIEHLDDLRVQTSDDSGIRVNILIIPQSESPNLRTPYLSRSRFRRRLRDAKHLENRPQKHLPQHLLWDLAWWIRT